MKVSEIIGLKVFVMNSGKQMSSIDDVVYDPRVNGITTLLIDKKGWSSDAKVIMFKDIRTINKDAVMIANENTIQKASNIVPGINEIVKKNTLLTDTKVVTDSGSSLGTIRDLNFDPRTGIVNSLEVSAGSMKKIPVSTIKKIGEDKIIVKNQVVQKPEKNTNDFGKTLQAGFD